MYQYIHIYVYVCIYIHTPKNRRIAREVVDAFAHSIPFYDNPWGLTATLINVQLRNLPVQVYMNVLR